MINFLEMTDTLIEQFYNQSVDFIQHPVESITTLNVNEKLFGGSILILLFSFYLIFDELLNMPSSKF